MGIVHADIKLINTDDLAIYKRGKIEKSEIRELTAHMMVDSGAYMMAVNDVVKEQLGLYVVDVRKAQLADGSIREFEIVGPIDVRFANRTATCHAMALPGYTEMLLGAIPIGEMDVLIHLNRNELIVNPAHPNIAQLPLK